MNLFSIMDGCCCTVMLNQSSCWGGYGWHDFLLCLFSMLHLLFKQYISIKYYIRHPSKRKPNRAASQSWLWQIRQTSEGNKCYVRKFIWNNLFFSGNEKPVASESAAFPLGSCAPGSEGIASRTGWKQTQKSLVLRAFSYTNCQNLDESPGQGLSGVYKPTISALRVSISPLVYT